MSVTTWNEHFELPGGSCSVSDIQEYFEYIIKKHETMTDNPAIRIYVNKIENRITFKIKTGYYFKLLMVEIIKLLERTKSKTAADKNDENMPHLEITEVVLIHCNIVNDYQHDSKVLYTFVPNKSSGQFFDISPKNFVFLRTFNPEISNIEVLFTDQNSKLLEIEDKINITLIISVTYKKSFTIQLNFCLLLKI